MICTSWETFERIIETIYNNAWFSTSRKSMNLEWPTCMLVSGPSGCGKSTFVKRIISDPKAVYGVEVGKIVFCYNEWQSSYDSLTGSPDILFIEGLPDISKLKAFKKPLLILDDLMLAMEKWSEAERLFTVCSHHFNMSVISIIHSVFYSKRIRNLRMHSSYLVLFKNVPDRLAIRNLATQIFPTNRQFFIDAYEDCTSLPHSYLFLDLHKSTEERFRLRNNIFPDSLTHCYVPK